MNSSDRIRPYGCFFFEQKKQAVETDQFTMPPYTRVKNPALSDQMLQYEKDFIQNLDAQEQQQQHGKHERPSVEEDSTSSSASGSKKQKLVNGAPVARHHKQQQQQQEEDAAGADQ